jgi:hypothetical protein
MRSEVSEQMVKVHARCEWVGWDRKPQVGTWGDMLASGSKSVPVLLLDPVHIGFD